MRLLFSVLALFICLATVCAQELHFGGCTVEPANGAINNLIGEVKKCPGHGVCCGPVGERTGVCCGIHSYCCSNRKCCRADETCCPSVINPLNGVQCCPKGWRCCNTQGTDDVPGADGCCKDGID